MGYHATTHRHTIHRHYRYSRYGGRIVLLVPLRPSALVMHFVDELYERAARQGLPVTRLSHAVTARLNSGTGAIDPEDKVSDVVQDPKSDAIFAEFTPRGSANTTISPVQQTVATNSTCISPSLSVRIVTAANANNPGACPIIQIPSTSTLRQLCDNIADRLNIPHKFHDNVDTHECNCRLADELTKHPRQDDSFLVVHGKSVVEHIHLKGATESTVYAALRSRLGSNFEDTNAVSLVGARPSIGTSTTVYTTPPTVAVCSKQRHTPSRATAKADEDQQKCSVLDMHTTELPMHPACMDVTLEESWLGDLATDGTVDIYCVSRKTTAGDAVSIGKYNIFCARPHWEPDVVQSVRGMAILLSSLRVFASIVQDMQEDESLQDSVLRIFDLLTKFPPALRALHILIQGKMPNACESAALSNAIYGALCRFISTFTYIIGSDHTRVFEGGRLLFGYILDKARALKLSRDDDVELPYFQGFRTLDLRDCTTGEAVMHAVSTSKGLVEARLFEYFQQGDSLAGSGMHTNMVATKVDANLVRMALLNGGMTPGLVVISSRPNSMQNLIWGRNQTSVTLPSFVHATSLLCICPGSSPL